MFPLKSHSGEVNCFGTELRKEEWGEMRENQKIALVKRQRISLVFAVRIEKKGFFLKKLLCCIGTNKMRWWQRYKEQNRGGGGIKDGQDFVSGL